MLRLAWCSPFPPERSGIADYSVELVEAIGGLAGVDVTLFVNDPAVFDAPSLNHLDRFPIEILNEKRFEFDLPIYQMGNHIVHQKIYEQAIKTPGITVLHEFDLNAFMTQLTMGQQHSAGYFREMVYASSSINADGSGALAYPDLLQLSSTIPFNQRLIDHSLGIVTHSRYVADLISTGRASTSKIKVIRQLGKLSDQVDLVAKDYWENKTLFACAGQITPEKQIDKVLDGMRQLIQDGIKAHLLLIGQPIAEIPLEMWIAERGLNDHVTVTGYVDSISAFEQQLAQAHVVINLRQPTIGETSAVVIRSMAVGRPVIVYDHGWYAELPDDGCIKIEPGSQTALIEAMRAAASDHDRLKAMGDTNRAEIKNHHRPEVVARDMVDWLEAVINDMQCTIG